MAKYSTAAQKSVESAMKKMEKGTLKSGKSSKKVTNPKQAIAIGLSQARVKAAEVPKKAATKKAATKKTVAKKAASTKTTKKVLPKKTAIKKSTLKKVAAKKSAVKKVDTKTTDRKKTVNKKINLSQAEINKAVHSNLPPVEEKSIEINEGHNGPIIDTDKKALAKALTKNDFKHPMHLSRGKQHIKSSSRKMLWR